jgi:glutamate 5-kinase
MAAEAGIPATICDGTRGGSLLGAARDEDVGTRFGARAGKASSFKLWLKYAKPARGRLTVDDGAARVLRERGSSLLPVGIVEVEGSFEVGDAVEVTANGAVVGKGIVDYSSQELSRVTGMKSAQVRELLPHAADEVIHRDRFVLV